MVANTPKVPVRLPKNMKVVLVGDALSKIVPVQEKISFDPVNAVLICEGKQDIVRQFEKHQQLTISNKENEIDDWNNHLNFIQKYDELQQVFKTMMSKYLSM